MKRWLVAVVVLINGVAWWRLDAQRASRMAAPPPQVEASATLPAGSVPKLLLLREVAPQPSAPPAPADVAPDAAAAAVTQEASADPGFAALPAIDTPAPAFEPARLSAEESEFLRPPERAQPSPLTDCLMLGGATEDQVVKWGDALRAAGLAAEQAEAAREEQIVSYRIIFPAGNEPQNDVARLRDAGIDALLLVEPNTPGRISAGVFGLRANALRRQQQLAEIGYVAEIVPLLRHRTSFWVRVRGAPGLNNRARELLDGNYRGDEAPMWRPCEALAEPAVVPVDDGNGLGGGQG